MVISFLGVIWGAEITHPDNMSIKRNIIFALESRKKAGIPIVENVPIRMRVNFASQRIEFTTGYRIDAVKWDADKQRVKNGCTNKLKQSAAEINASLLGYYTETQEIFKKFEVDEVMPTPEQIKEAFNALHRPAEEEAKPSKKKKPRKAVISIRSLMSLCVIVDDRMIGRIPPMRSLQP